MTINQSVVSNNIRGLQSRTHKRGKLLAQYERSRTAAKVAIKNLRLVGYPVAVDLLDFKDALGRSVIALAKDQTLDRQLLKQQYVLQSQARPAKLPKLPKSVPSRPSIGQTVTMQEGGMFFKAGAVGRVVEGCGPEDSNIWVTFEGQGNLEGSFDPYFEHVCLGDVGTYEFTVNP